MFLKGYFIKIVLICCSFLDRTKCQDGEFRCDDGQCVTLRAKCDGDYDCDDHTDETNKDCHEHHHQGKTFGESCLSRTCAYWLYVFHFIRIVPKRSVFLCAMSNRVEPMVLT